MWGKWFGAQEAWATVVSVHKKNGKVFWKNAELGGGVCLFGLGVEEEDRPPQGRKSHL